MSDPQHYQLSQHQFEKMLRTEEVEYLYEDNHLLNTYGATIESPAMAHINREMMPILAELMTLGPKNHEHPTVKQLFTWLMDPNRTGEEFHYVIGPLQLYVTDIMLEHFEIYVYDEDGYTIYLWKAAAEALAVKCPILEGPWEHIAWLLVKESYSYYKYSYGPVSDCLSAWIIHMIGNPDICYNPYLRFELINVIETRINCDYFHHDKQTQALESVLSALSFLTVDYYITETDYAGCFQLVDLFCITQMLRKFVNDKHMMGFDEELSIKLQYIQTSRLSSLIHSSSYLSVENHKYCNQPIALNGLSALLKTIFGYGKKHMNTFKARNWITVGGVSTLFAEIHAPCVAFSVLISKFPKSCQTSQLVELTESCLLTILETVFSIKTEMNMYDMDPYSLYDINMLLRVLLDDSCVIPIVHYILCHDYQGRFERLVRGNNIFNVFLKSINLI